MTYIFHFGIVIIGLLYMYSRLYSIVVGFFVCSAPTPQYSNLVYMYKRLSVVRVSVSALSHRFPTPNIHHLCKTSVQYYSLDLYYPSVHPY